MGCMDGAECKNRPRLSEILPQDGWWKVPRELKPNTQNMFMSCPYPNDCKNSSCSENTINESIVCSRCKVGFDRIGDECVVCRNGEIGIRIGAVVGAAGILALVLYLARRRIHRALERIGPA